MTCSIIEIWMVVSIFCLYTGKYTSSVVFNLCTNNGTAVLYYSFTVFISGVG